LFVSMQWSTKLELMPLATRLNVTAEKQDMGRYCRTPDVRTVFIVTEGTNTYRKGADRGREFCQLRHKQYCTNMTWRVPRTNVMNEIDILTGLHWLAIDQVLSRHGRISGAGYETRNLVATKNGMWFIGNVHQLKRARKLAMQNSVLSLSSVSVPGSA
jgi:hypothetical protein